MSRADDAAERAVRSCAATLVGEIAHEMNNRLATMRETVGLLDDLTRAGKAGAAATARAHASLDDQVGRALNIVRTLGGLGGALGAGRGSFDAGEVLGDLLGMTERWARRHSLRVERAIAPGLPPAAGDPGLFLCLAHRLLCRCAEMQREGSSLHVRLCRAGEGISLRLAPGGPRTADAAAPAAGDEALDRELAGRLGGELSFEGGGAATILLKASR